MLNIGSGQRRFSKPFLNVDHISREGQVPDMVADARDLPFPDGAASVCVLHHVLEHFGCGEADGVVRECHRVLEHSGRLLVFVPDMAELSRRWVQGKISDYIFNVNTYGAYQGDEGDRHKWGYSDAGLRSYLVGVCEWREVHDKRAVPQLAGADIADDWWIAGAVCVK